jgi:hypothetical protein
VKTSFSPLVLGDKRRERPYLSHIGDLNMTLNDVAKLAKDANAPVTVDTELGDVVIMSPDVYASLLDKIQTVDAPVDDANGLFEDM